MARHLLLRPGVTVLATLVTILALAGVAVWSGFDAARDARDWSRHTYDVLGVVKDLNLAVKDAEDGQCGYLLTGDEGQLAPYETAVARLEPLQGELRRLTADNAAQQGRLDALAPALRRTVAELAQGVGLRRSVGPDPALTGLGKDVPRADEEGAQAILTAMTREERDLLDKRQRAADERGWILGALVLGGTLLATLALIGATYALNRALSRSKAAETEQRALAVRLRATLESLSQGVAVFDGDRRLMHWNGCFEALLDLPTSLLWSGAPYAAMADHLGTSGTTFWRTRDGRARSRTAPSPLNASAATVTCSKSGAARRRTAASS